jgi:hypothetical protein
MLMRKAEEQCRENELGLLSERVSENGLRRCSLLPSAMAFSGLILFGRFLLFYSRLVQRSRF